ncbi:MAG: ATP-binding protein [Syntrophomonas sp.]
MLLSFLGVFRVGKRLNKHIFKKVRNANLKYKLVEDGDRVAVAVSGGKDSFTMLYFLYMLRKYTPLRFELVPIYVDLGWENDMSGMEEFCKRLNLTLIIEKTNIGKVVFEERREKNPCSLCSNLRRGALSRISKEHKCNKVALGHHLNDVVNTMFLSILYESRFNVFKPLTYLDRTDISIIRPLIYVDESQIRQFMDSLDFLPAKNRCPADGLTRRTEVDQLLDTIEKHYPGARKRFLASLENIGPDTFWQ